MGYEQLFLSEFEGVFLHTFIYHEGVTPDTPYLLTVESSSGSELELNTLTPTMPVMQDIQDIVMMKDLLSRVNVPPW